MSTTAPTASSNTPSPSRSQENESVAPASRCVAEAESAIDWPTAAVGGALA